MGLVPIHLNWTAQPVRLYIHMPEGLKADELDCQGSALTLKALYDL